MARALASADDPMPALTGLIEGLGAVLFMTGTGTEAIGVGRFSLTTAGWGP